MSYIFEKTPLISLSRKPVPMQARSNYLEFE